ncbi:aldehyde dehydrogenase [Acetobacter aceti NRIC 0242]|uniref:Aldehyde dehydrogenase domain-containing protein n=1 Tax=Acetobacter aceti NBRC 14818 TaxID=887700 RepID=A0AB33IF90_ACEAC|nr:aldehyde dehydrogenase family protein [Acetobacter aceti NBRC 14818]BCK76582.1 hypothetical protein EMQ_2188 [Acetobacter aceti NBRC 14818]GAN58583.1 aldehyde dehydrogenase [Acetobacter aceti NBRC 14818]GBO81537.1 aldehyde dehydrogenase [Acetobacter aceti NRIC 0242]
MPSQTRYNLFIDGSWTKPASGEWTQIRNPATGDVVGEAARGQEQDVKIAVEAARKAFPAWRDTPASKRADALYKLRDLVARDKETLARTITSEMGKTLKEAQERLISPSPCCVSPRKTPVVLKARSSPESVRAKRS